MPTPAERLAKLSELSPTALALYAVGLEQQIEDAHLASASSGSSEAVQSTDELIDGIKRRVGVTLSNQDASAEWLMNQVRGMQRFVVEWEKRNSQTMSGGKA